MEDISVNIWFCISHEEYLHSFHQTDDVSALINMCYEHCKADLSKDYNREIKKYLKENKDCHPDDALELAVRNNISLNYNEADRLRQGDIISANYFIPSTLLGQAILACLYECNLQFVMRTRIWESHTRLALWFELADSLWSFNVSDILIYGYDQSQNSAQKSLKRLSKEENGI